MKLYPHFEMLSVTIRHLLFDTKYLNTFLCLRQSDTWQHATHFSRLSLGDEEHRLLAAILQRSHVKPEQVLLDALSRP